MCGIAGLALAAAAPPPEPATLAALARALAHRGPEGTGHTAVGRIALVHTRLAFIDLPGGDQPLFAGAAALVANAEVYNYRELRRDLPDVRFATNSDCEPPLHLWLRDGAAYAAHLRGMYAIAIHERAARTVTLTRDPFGIKPLYTAPSRRRPRLRLRAAGAARRRPGRARRAAGGARRAAAIAVHDRGARRSSPACSACCRARR